MPIYKMADASGNKVLVNARNAHQAHMCLHKSALKDKPLKASDVALEMAAGVKLVDALAKV